MGKKDKTSWNFIDKIIAGFRYNQVDKYIIPNSCVVDIGCGQEGIFLLRHKYKISRGYGFDHKIKDYKVDNITFVNNSNINGLPLDDNSVDTVFLNAVLEHLKNPKELLKETIRILKKGGKVVMTTPTPKSKSMLEFLAFKLHIINESEIREHEHYYSKNDIYKLVSELNEFYKLEINEYKKFELGYNSLIVLKKL